MLKIDIYLDTFSYTKFSYWHVKKIHDIFVNNEKTNNIKK